MRRVYRRGSAAVAPRPARSSAAQRAPGPPAAAVRHADRDDRVRASVQRVVLQLPARPASTPSYRSGQALAMCWYSPRKSPSGDAAVGISPLSRSAMQIARAGAARHRPLDGGAPDQLLRVVHDRLARQSVDVARARAMVGVRDGSEPERHGNGDRQRAHLGGCRSGRVGPFVRVSRSTTWRSEPGKGGAGGRRPREPSIGDTRASTRGFVMEEQAGQTSTRPPLRQYTP